MRVGFTGTRHGLGLDQFEELIRVMEYLTRSECCLRWGNGDEITIHDHPTLYHGDCVGADEQADEVAASMGWTIVIHPPSNDRYRAHCERKPGILRNVRVAEEYMRRNTLIVSLADVMLACPRENHEVTRSGTWATVRLARKRLIHTAFIWPQGRTTLEGSWVIGGKDMSCITEK